jgi:head-tail adaptor
MRAGELRHRVTIQPVGLGAQDAYGQYATSTGTASTAWAKIEPLSGRIGELVRSLHPTATHKVTMRFRSGLGVKTHQLAFGTRTFAINEIRNEDERGKSLVLVCTEAL